MPRIISRGEWGARHGDGRWPRPLPAREAWLHHSVTIAPDFKAPYGDDDRAIRTIEQIGANRFGSVYGFPYTFGVTPVGRIYAGHNVGKTGAHTKGHNTVGIGIVLVGNYETRRPTGSQLDACAWLLRECERRGWLRDARLTGGHRDVSATACPGDHAYARIDDINRRARSGDFTEEDDMPEPKELWDHQFGPTGHPDNPEWKASSWIVNIEKGGDTAIKLLRDIKARQAGQDAAIKALAESRGLSGDEMTAVVSEAVHGELAAFEAKLADAEVVLRPGEE